jgi:RNase P subunit RPR2
MQIKLFREKCTGNGLAQKYVDILVGLSKRTDVVLPSSLKRAEQCLDEENFEKLSKKIKID